MVDYRKNNGENMRENDRFQPLGELRPVDQTTEMLTATADDAGRVTVGDVGETAREITEHEDEDEEK